MKLQLFRQFFIVTLLSGFFTLVSAAGTTAGTDVTNTATLSFGDSIDSTTDVQSNAEVFKVDKKIDLTVTTVDIAAIQTKPGATAVVLTYKVTNTGNSIQDYSLSTLRSSTTAFGESATTTFDATNVLIYVDSDGNGQFDASSDTQINYIDELGIDGEKFIFVIADMPTGIANAAVAIYDLQAQVAEGDTVGTKGADILTDSGNEADNKLTVQIVFADGAGTADGEFDGKYSNVNAYKIVIADMTITKDSVVINDPFNGSTNPKRIPGATIRYCFSVENSGSAATLVAKIGDNLDETVYDVSSLTNSDIRIYTGLDLFECATADTLTGLQSNPATGSVDNTTGAIVIDLEGVDAGAKKSVYFEVTLR